MHISTSQASIRVAFGLSGSHAVGYAVGTIDGPAVGTADGLEDGKGVEGVKVGVDDGTSVGIAEGAPVGAQVCSQHVAGHVKIVIARINGVVSQQRDGRHDTPSGVLSINGHVGPSVGVNVGIMTTGASDGENVSTLNADGTLVGGRVQQVVGQSIAYNSFPQFRASLQVTSIKYANGLSGSHCCGMGGDVSGDNMVGANVGVIVTICRFDNVVGTNVGVFVTICPFGDNDGDSEGCLDNCVGENVSVGTIGEIDELAVITDTPQHVVWQRRLVK